MKVLLIYPKSKIWNTPTQIPLGLAYLGAVLKRAGHEVKVFDMMVEEELVKVVKEFKPVLVGISANTPLIKGAWSAAKVIKQISKAYIVLGGPHPTSLPDESLAQEYIDGVIIGEGEKSILSLVQALAGYKSFEEVEGLVYRGGDRKIKRNPPQLVENLDSLPFPAYELFKVDHYSVTQPLKDPGRKGARAFYLMTSRGCPYNCVFCFKGIYQRIWRSHSPEYVISEWRYLVEKLKATEIGVQDDVFNLNKPRALKICRMLKQEGLDKIPWVTNNGIRADYTDFELLRAMKEAGCKRVAFGIETGDETIVKNIDKKLSLEKVEKAINEAKKASLSTMGFFMFGNPGENEVTMEKTIRFALKLDPDVAHFSIATPYPGTRLYYQILKEGKLLNKNWEEYGILEGKGMFELKEVNPQLVTKFWRRAYRKFYLRPKRILKEIFKIRNWLNLPVLLRAARQYFFKLT